MSFYALAALARNVHVPKVMGLILEGRVAEASAMAEGLLDEPGACDAASAAELAHLCGDLMLAQDRGEEAEDMYRRAVRAAMHAPRGQVRVASCRTTGVLSLYQQRFGTASACFHRVTEDPAATLAQKVEALGGLALAHHGMGQTARAVQALDAAAELVADEQVPAGGGASPAAARFKPLTSLVSMLRVELLVRQEIRAHAALRDHVFWQAPSTGVVRPREELQALATIDMCLNAHGQHPLFGARLRHMRALVLATCGDASAMPTLHAHLGWLRQAGMSSDERQSRLETALVAIAARNADMARALLEPLNQRGGDSRRQRWNLELSYCMAKVCALSGRIEESLDHYQRYALDSMQCVRTETLPEQAPARRAGAETAVRDDVEMSLPAKYRRAYRYLLDHLDCAALSIREIAEHIGVTERALQSVFRSHLGMTPVEVMRRCRVERIRQELMTDDASQHTVLEAAARWGIRNRSTLVSAYRKYFSETPAETLSRRSSCNNGTVRLAA